MSTFKVYKIDKSGNATLLTGVSVVGGVKVARGLIVTNDGVEKLLKIGEDLPTTVLLESTAGHDRSLYDLFLDIQPFKLKITMSDKVMGGEGQITDEDILDIDLVNCLATPLEFGATKMITVQTVSSAKVTYLKKAIA